MACYGNWIVLLWKFWKGSLASIAVYTLMLGGGKRIPALFQNIETFTIWGEEIQTKISMLTGGDGGIRGYSYIQTYSKNRSPKIAESNPLC